MAVSIQTLTGQDSPNSGRIKVNENFSSLKTVVDGHITYLTALQGDVVSTDASQTIINKVITSNNATSGAGNSITIAKDDFAGEWFGVANTYSGISIGDAKIQYINKTSNTLTISGFGGIEPQNDTVNRVISIGFPATAYMDHADGNQSLVINERTRLGGATLDVNGLTSIRNSVEIGDASTGTTYSTAQINTLLHIKDGTGSSTKYTFADIESRGGTADAEGAYLNLKRNPGQNPVQDGYNLGAVTFTGNFASGSTSYDDPRTATRIQGTATSAFASGDRKASLDFFVDKGGSAIAEKIMTIAGGDDNEAGAGVVIGRDSNATGVTRRGVLTVADNTSSIGFTDVHNKAETLVLIDTINPGITFVTKASESTREATINFQQGDATRAKIVYNYHYAHLKMTQDSDTANFTFDMQDQRLGIGSDNQNPTYALQVHGTSGSPRHVSTDVLRIESSAGQGHVTNTPSSDSFTLYNSLSKQYVLQTPGVSGGNFKLRSGTRNIFQHWVDNDKIRLDGHDIEFWNTQDTGSSYSYIGLRTQSASDSKWYFQSSSGTGYSAQNTQTIFQTAQGSTYNSYLDGIEFDVDGKPRLRLTKDGGVHIGSTSNVDGSGSHALPGRHHQGSGGTIDSGLRAGVVTYGSVLMGSLGNPDPDSGYTDGYPASSLGDSALLFSVNPNMYGTYGDGRQITIVDGNESSNIADGGLVINTGSHKGGFGIHQTQIASFSQRWDDKPQVKFGVTPQMAGGQSDISSRINGSAGNNTTCLIVDRDNAMALAVAGLSLFDGSVYHYGGLHVEDIRLGAVSQLSPQKPGHLALRTSVSTLDPGNSHVFHVQDKKPISTLGNVSIVFEQTGTGNGKRTTGIRQVRSGSSSTPGELRIGRIPDPSQGGVNDMDVVIECDSTAAFILPKGNDSQRPGGAGSDYAAASGQCRFNTQSSSMEVYNGTAWVGVGVPPVGSTFLQYGPSNLDNSPNTLYPGTTWVTGDVPADHFIRSVGANRGNDEYRGARPYMTQQDDMIAQHTHRSTSMPGGYFEWNSGTDLSGNKGKYSEGGSWIERTDSEWGYNKSIYDGWMVSQGMPDRNANYPGYWWGLEAYNHDMHILWYASESYNNAYLSTDNFGVETGRVVHNNDRRVEPGNNEEDAYGFHQEAGAGRVRSYGGVNGAGGFWSGYIGGNNQKYYTGDENRPMNVAIKFWRRQA